jgi:hypothetical protein
MAVSRGEQVREYKEKDISELSKAELKEFLRAREAINIEELPESDLLHHIQTITETSIRLHKVELLEQLHPYYLAIQSISNDKAQVNAMEAYSKLEEQIEGIDNAEASVDFSPLARYFPKPPTTRAILEAIKDLQSPDLLKQETSEAENAVKVGKARALLERARIAEGLAQEQKRSSSSKTLDAASLSELRMEYKLKIKVSQSLDCLVLNHVITETQKNENIQKLNSLFDRIKKDPSDIIDLDDFVFKFLRLEFLERWKQEEPELFGQLKNYLEDKQFSLLLNNAVNEVNEVNQDNLTTRDEDEAFQSFFTLARKFIEEKLKKSYDDHLKQVRELYTELLSSTSPLSSFDKHTAREGLEKIESYQVTPDVLPENPKKIISEMEKYIAKYDTLLEQRKEEKESRNKKAATSLPSTSKLRYSTKSRSSVTFHVAPSRLPTIPEEPTPYEAPTPPPSPKG